MKYLGIDYGTKRIGLAKSDCFGLIAQFYKTIYMFKNKEKFFIVLKNIIKENNIEGIVIGLPYHLNGDISDKIAIIKTFGKDLKEKFSLPIFYEDERLSTVEAKRIMCISNTNKKKNKEKIDSISAAIILQKFIDKKNNKIYKKGNF